MGNFSGESDPVAGILSGLKTVATDPGSVIDLKIPGVYFLFCEGELVYVGQSRHVPDRIADHVREKRLSFDSVSFIPVPVEKLLETESYYIDLLWPTENRTGDRSKVRKQLDDIERNWVEEEFDSDFSKRLTGLNVSPIISRGTVI